MECTNPSRRTIKKHKFNSKISLERMSVLTYYKNQFPALHIICNNNGILTDWKTLKLTMRANRMIFFYRKLPIRGVQDPSKFLLGVLVHSNLTAAMSEFSKQHLCQGPISLFSPAAAFLWWGWLILSIWDIGTRTGKNSINVKIVLKKDAVLLLSNFFLYISINVSFFHNSKMN